MRNSFREHPGEPSARVRPILRLPRRLLDGALPSTVRKYQDAFPPGKAAAPAGAPAARVGAPVGPAGAAP
eukprot:6291502-Pyramimonas_sp.AAC.2